jgi:hypothetical protein
MGNEIESYLSSVDWAERIIAQGVEQNSKNWLLNDVALYLEDEYNIPQVNGWNSVKARELMDGKTPDNPKLKDQAPMVAGKSERERKLVFKQIVKEAHEKGYLENFQLSEPWHPRLFMEGEMNTYPYQHNTMITFRGVSRDHFYLGGDDPEGKGRDASKRHSESVLNLGHWNPGNSFNSDNEDAVWTTFKDTAEEYASRKNDGKRGVLLKMQVPTKWVQCGAHGVREVNNMREIQSEFGSPEAYRQHVRNESDERCAWLVRPKVPLHFIKKIWDLEIFNTSKPGYALPLQSENRIDGIDLMHFFQKKKLPDQPNFGDADNHKESWQIVSMKRIISDAMELKDFCQETERNLQLIKDKKEYSMDLVRKVVKEEQGINQLIAGLVDSARQLDVSTNLETMEAGSIEQIEQQIEKIHVITEKIEENSENDVSSLISDGKVSNKFRELVDELHEIQVGAPEKVEAAEILESKNQALREVTSNVVENFRRLKIGYETYTQFRGYENRPLGLEEFDTITEQISEDVGGPSEGVNQAVKELAEAAEKLSLKIQIEEQEVSDLDSLQKALGRVLKVTKIIDNRVKESIEHVVSEGEVPRSLAESVENIYLIKISDSFEDNVSSSQEKLSNELRVLRTEIEDGLQVVNWFYQLEARFAEVVEMTEQAQQRGKLKQQELRDIHDALFSYENTQDKELGTAHIIKKSRTKLHMSEEVQKPEAKNLKTLNEAARKRLKFIEQEKPKVQQVENKLDHMKQEIESMNITESYHDIPKDRLQSKLREMQGEFEHIVSEDGELGYFFSNIKNVSWDYYKYKSKVENRS